MGGVGGIIYILVSGVFLLFGFIFLKFGNFIGCVNVVKVFLGFLLIRGLLDILIMEVLDKIIENKN